MNPRHHSQFRKLVVDQSMQNRRSSMGSCYAIIIFVCLVALLLLQSFTFTSSPSLRTEYPPSLVPDVNTEPQEVTVHKIDIPEAPSANLRTRPESALPVVATTALSENTSYRVAVLVPNMRNSLPSWFLAFAFSAQLSSPLLDWFIFMDNPTYLELPPNIHIIHMTEHEYYTRIALLDNSMSRTTPSLSAAATAVGKLIAAYPYFLVEVKPALGTIFEDYVVGYSHWAFADIDVMIGRVTSFITPDILRTYDIYTASFGDNTRLYMRGQMTVIRATHTITSMWRHCSHLTHLLSRVHKYLHAADATWQLQSAEGCFSRVVADHNVSIFFSNTQLSDAFHAPTREKESLLLGSSLLRCHKAPLNSSMMQSYLLSSPQRVKHPVKSTILTEVPRVGPGCANWIHPMYQVCVAESNVTKTTELIVRGGKAYKYIDPYEPPSISGGQCREAIVSHFQGWKRLFHKYMTRAPPLNANTLLLSQSGFSPLITPELPSYGSLMQLSYAIGVVHHPHVKVPSRNATVAVTTNYCLKFASDVKKCACFIDFDEIKVFPHSQQFDRDRVTLVRSGIILHNASISSLLEAWEGPQVLVVGYSGRYPDDIGSSSLATVVLVDVTRCRSGTATLVADNTLLNIGLDVTLTDRVLVSPLHIRFSQFAERDIHHRLQLAEAVDHLAALVIPTYSSIDVSAYDALRSESELPTSYPPNSVASDQSPSLVLSYEESSVIMMENISIGLFDDDSLQKALHKYEVVADRVVLPQKALSINTFIGEKSLLLPVAFNIKKNEHGDSFVRLPEELDGSLCYGSVILSILESAGYALEWAPVRAAAALEESVPLESCAHGTHSSRNAFTAILTEYCQSILIPYLISVSYLKRTQKLRESGINKVYTTYETLIVYHRLLF